MAVTVLSPSYYCNHGQKWSVGLNSGSQDGCKMPSKFKITLQTIPYRSKTAMLIVHPSPTHDHHKHFILFSAPSSEWLFHDDTINLINRTSQRSYQDFYNYITAFDITGEMLLTWHVGALMWYFLSSAFSTILAASSEGCFLQPHAAHGPYHCEELRVSTSVLMTPLRNLFIRASLLSYKEREFCMMCQYT